jgi:hypothetical protein
VWHEAVPIVADQPANPYFLAIPQDASAYGPRWSTSALPSGSQLINILLVNPFRNGGDSAGANPTVFSFLIPAFGKPEQKQTVADDVTLAEYDSMFKSGYSIEPSAVAAPDPDVDVGCPDGAPDCNLDETASNTSDSGK